uniref:CYTH domain-containing protein n=1 Tax=Paraburkholderia TaxID=1822464 RepID=UPI0032186326
MARQLSMTTRRELTEAVGERYRRSDRNEKLRHAPLLAQSRGGSGSSRLLTSTHFDTPELAFHWCKASLRVRAVGNERHQTLKLEGSVQAGLFDRD